MNKEDKDARVIDYLMDELPPHEREEFAQELEQDAGLREMLAEYQALGDLAKQELAKEPAPELAELQRRKLSNAINERAWQTNRHLRKRLLYLGGMLAAAAIAVAVFLPQFLKPSPEELQAQREETELRMRIAQLPEGYERFLIGDINNPAGAAQAQLQKKNLADPEVRAEAWKDLEKVEQILGPERLAREAKRRDFTPELQHSDEVPGAVNSSMSVSQLSAEKPAPVVEDGTVLRGGIGYKHESDGQTHEGIVGTAPRTSPEQRDEWQDSPMGNLKGVPVDESVRVGKAEPKKEERPGLEVRDIVKTYPQAAPPAPPPAPASSPALPYVSTLSSNVSDRQAGSVAVGQDYGFVEQRTGLGVKADFTDQVLPQHEFGPPGNGGFDPTTGLQNLGYLGSAPQQKTYNYDINGDGVAENIPFYTRPDGSVVISGARTEVSLWSVPPPGNVASEAYGQYVEQAFQTVAQQPLSTFSIDVDTASYSNVRRFLAQQGQLPPADAVRVEELINYFDYTYPQPTGEHPFSVQVDLAGCPWAPEHLLARVGLQGKDVPRGERPPANLVFLLDVSGSMNDPNKLPLVKESMKALLDTLQLNDRVGIVTYAGNSQIALMSTSCDNKPAILQAIDALGAGGSTNGAAGIHDAYTMAANNFIAGGINRVILATDGDFNVGATDTGALLQLIAEKAKGKVFLTALGYGMGNLKDGRLEELADKGNGNYAYIDSFAEARKALVDQVNGTLMTIAKDVKIQVEFNPGKVGSYRLIGYDNRVLAAQDFNDDTKDAGEIGAGHRVTALYEIVPVGAPVQAGVDALKYQQPAPTPPPAQEVASSPEWLTAKLRYKLPEGDTSTKLEVPVTADPVAMPQASEDFRLASSAAAFGLVLKNSPYKGSATLDMAQQLAQSALNADKPEQRQQRQELVDLIVRAKTLRP